MMTKTNLDETEMCPFCAFSGRESYAVYSHDNHQKNGLFEEWICPYCDAKTLIRADISIAENEIQILMLEKLQAEADEIEAI